MKTIIILLAVLIIGCKKDNIDTCIIGKWKYTGNEQHGVFTPTNVNSFYTFNSNKTFASDVSYNGRIYHAEGTYSISGDILYLNNIKKDRVVCSGSKLKLNPISIDPTDSNDPSSYQVYNKN